MTHEEVENMIEKLLSGEGNSPQESASTADTVSQIIPVLTSEADKYLQMFDELLEEYLPVIQEYVERAQDYSNARDIEAINKLSKETSLSVEDAANFILRKKAIQVEAVQKQFNK